MLIRSRRETLNSTREGFIPIRKVYASRVKRSRYIPYFDRSPQSARKAARTFVVFRNPAGRRGRRLCAGCREVKGRVTRRFRLLPAIVTKRNPQTSTATRVVQSMSRPSKPTLPSAATVIRGSIRSGLPRQSSKRPPHRVARPVYVSTKRRQSSDSPKFISKDQLLAQDWDFDDSSANTLGPSLWGQKFPECYDPYQSPINIVRPAIRYKALPPLTFELQNVINSQGGNNTFKLINTGTTVTLKPTSQNIINIQDGGLPGTFVLDEIHFHWSRSDTAGSEHLLEGRAYPLEMHIVTRNTKFARLQDAMDEEDGVHVIGVFFDVTNRNNDGLSMCFSQMEKVRNPGTQLVDMQLPLQQILASPSNSYFRYVGSLTTPPCSRSVIWSVFESPQSISTSQLNQLRSIRFTKGLRRDILGNNRPPQPINRRRILTNNIFYQ